MSSSDFSLADVKTKLQLTVIENQTLMFDYQDMPPSEFLKNDLERFLPLALAVNTEKSRSEWIIAPIWLN